MIRFLDTMRRIALETFSRSHRVVVGKLLRSQLCLEHPIDCFKCMEAYGFDPDVQNQSIVTKNRKGEWQVSIMKFR